MSTAITNSFPVIEGRLDREFLRQRRAESQERRLEIDAQMWTCCECGTARQWGFSRPEDRKAKPALACDDCHAMTRHAFLGIAGLMG